MIPPRAWPVIKLARVGAFILFTILPLVQMTVLSFTATLAQDGLSLGETTLRNYRAIWADPSLRAAFGNSCTTRPRPRACESTATSMNEKIH